jgi:glycerol-3-phosphate acyltransferase PlsY
LLNAYLHPLADLKPIMVAAIASGALIIFMHRANIGRLLRGMESKFE